MKAYEKLLKEKILKENIIPKDVLDKTIHQAESADKTFLSSLLECSSTNEDQILNLLADILSTKFIDLRKKDVSEEVLEKIPAKFAWHYQFIPISLKEGRLTIAVNIPLETKTQDEIELITGFKVSIVLAKQKKIKELLKSCYGLGAETIEEMVSDKSKEMTADSKIKDWDVEDIREKAGEASVIKLVNQIIAEAHSKRSTDIHIEPYRGKIRLRYRIDGVLFDQYVPEKLSRFLPAIISRIKIMSNLNIVERRIPQDGRALVRVEEQVLDLRISIVPTPHGESVVIRILPTKMFFNLEGLGLSKNELIIFDNLLKKPNGIVFVTGPTGSGKTTTLYACLRQINSQENKIISIEDPIEYEMKDVIQIQVNPSVGLTFAQGLRSMLRHDPDIMMVGEVRDKETAEIAVRVALTGHLVLSTLHTNDAPSSITRLIDIGIEPYLLASSVEAFVAQRLVRVICSKCKKEISDIDPKLKQHIKSSLSINRGDDLRFFKGSGCEKCNFTGFYGRTAVYEILLVDRNIRDLIKKRSSASEIRKNAIDSGMKTILQDCWQKVIKGVTTVEEALRLSQDFLAEMEVIDAKTKKVISKEEKKVDSGNSGDKNSHFDFENKRLHKRKGEKINIKFKLVDKSQGEILKIKDKGESDSEHTNLDSFFDDYITNKNSDKVYQGISEVVENVSEGGVLFRSQYSLPLGSILEINLEFPNISKSINCLAKVVRVEKELPVCFYIAVCFMDISGAERKAIKEALKE